MTGRPGRVAGQDGLHPGRTITVVGGGPAGLAAAVALRRVGLDAVVLEQSDAVGAVWRGRYDRLRLNTSRMTSGLIGMRYPRGTGLFPTRDEFASYLERYVETHQLDVRLGVRVERLDRADGTWNVVTSDGGLSAEQVIVATGYAGKPFLPAWPGRFEGPLVHAAEYREPRPYSRRDVLVVGPASSGMEIAYDLAEGGARRVRLSVRTPPNIVLRSVGGVPSDLPALPMLRLPARVADAQLRAMRRLLLGDLTSVGLPMPDEGVVARMRRLGVGPAVVDREVVRSIQDGRVEIVAGVEALEGDGVRLADGKRLETDAIVAATGYRTGLDPLVGHLDVLDPRGVPRVVGGREAAPGLRFVGFDPVPGQIRRAGLEAKRAAGEIRRSSGPARPAALRVAVRS